MGWNEPGGNGSKDPWGNRNNDDGPPDIDEVVRKIQDKVTGIFGGKGKGGGSPSTPSGNAPGNIAIMIVVILAALAYLAFDMGHIIQAGERGVVLRFGAFETILEPGLNIRLPRPIEKVEKINIDQIRTVTHKATMLTQDENIVDIEMAVQYRIKDAYDYQFNVLAPDAVLRGSTESAVREVIGKSVMDFVLTEGRSKIAADIKLLIQGILDSYKAGLVVTSVNMQPSKPPEQVKSAFDDAIKSREDEQRLINEAEAYRNEIIPKARGGAARQREEANAYKAQVVARATGQASRFTQLLLEYQKAPDVTRQRLYLDTVETVLSSTNKVMLDAKGGNNVMYLPLDKLIDRPARTGNLQQRILDSEASGSGPSADQDIRSRANLRDRGSR
jgi:membrane protease subunit HflK